MKLQGADITGNKKAHRIPNPMSKRLYTIKEAAVYLGRPVWGIRSLIWDGKIRYIQDGRKYYLDVKDMDAYIESQKRTFT